MAVRLLRSLALALTALGLAASPALASLADEVAAGAAVATQLEAQSASCGTLTDTQFERLGEYVMDRMAGSRAAHEAMNARMEQALGGAATERMHQLVGRRFAGCDAGDASGVPFGPGMMGSGGGMMRSAAWGWMHDGTWRHMGSADWRDLAASMMGTRAATHHRWTTGGVLVGVLALLALGALVTVLLVRRPRRGPPPAAPTAA